MGFSAISMSFEHEQISRLTLTSCIQLFDISMHFKFLSFDF